LPSMDSVLHIASFIVHHRPESAAALDAAIAIEPMIELAVRDGGRSVLLCEAEDERGLMDQIDALRLMDGVMGVSLVHHHAESKQSLQKEIEHGNAP